MAKTSKIAKKGAIRTGTPEERAEAMAALRVRVRELTHRSELPGVSKASW